MTCDDNNGKTGGIRRKDLLAKWQKLLAVVERRFNQAADKDEANGKIRPETDKTVATYIKTLQAFAKEVKQLEANGAVGKSAASEVARDLWTLSLSKRDRTLIASILKDLDVPVDDELAERGGSKRGRGDKHGQSRQTTTAQRDLPLDEPGGEEGIGEGVDGPA